MSKFAILPLFLFLLLTQPVFGQVSDETAAERSQSDLKLAEQILADAGGLRLPENRAIVFAEVGGFFCSADQQRARGLFHKSIADLIVAQQQAAEIRKSANAIEQLTYGQMPRRRILDAIARCDAELAIELLKRSRPEKLSRLMATDARNDTNYRRYYADAEIAAEQRFISMAADQNPARAIELLRESLKKGVTTDTMYVLQKILHKDEKAAGKLAEEAVQKLLDGKFTLNDYQLSSTAQYFLAELGRQRSPDVKTLEVSESSVKDLADKISSFWLENKSYNYSIATDGFKMIEKYFPARAARIRQINDQNGQREEYERYNKLVGSDATAEELVSQAGNFNSYRTSILSTAARKMGESGGVSQAVSLINSQFSEEESEQQVSDLFYNLASGEMSRGNFDGASRLVDQIPAVQGRLNALLQLAQTIYQTNGEAEKRWALSVLDQALALIDTSDLTQSEISSLIQVSIAYSTIEPGQAFRTLEMTISPLNDFIRANAVVSQFRNEQMQRNGEFFIAANEGFPDSYNFAIAMQNLSGKDFDRAISLINSFERVEIRIGLKLELIRSNSAGDGVSFLSDISPRP